jgi:signal transduction histidine kinase
MKKKEAKQTGAPKAAPGALTPFKRRKQLESDLEHITQEMYKRNKELTETNTTLSLLRQIDTLVLESQDSLSVICQQITDIINAETDYPLVALLTRLPHSLTDLELSGWSSKGIKNDSSRESLRYVRVSLKQKWFRESKKNILMPITKLSDEQLARFMGCGLELVAGLRAALPIQSIYAVKLFARGRLVGVIMVGFDRPLSELSEWDSQLLDRLSQGIGLALDNKLLFEENKVVLQQLRHSNAKLRALDETKDDFISMASHQLRTPLTSIKGYLSLMLEGDAGRLTGTQRKMANQAFTSSQRMVYLIADLLNVSRLKTGKFVIEPKPTNLAQLISEEIDQLVETTAARNIELTYDKPKDFPALQLDETKTRQVVMNFIDNAIYYTPSGGHIKVVLEETPTSIEFKVIDDGIGVPKSEQHHLFTKFYRAGNARKARPDGTGLGLFMAKKVILAQGGSIIFESKEGEGSTFGFLFAKSQTANLKKLPVKAAAK